MVEYILGKDEVTGSIPVMGSRVFGSWKKRLLIDCTDKKIRYENYPCNHLLKIGVISFKTGGRDGQSKV